MNKLSDILFFDLEVGRKQRIQELGIILGEHEYHDSSIQKIQQLAGSAKWICGHNIIQHDLEVLSNQFPKIGSRLRQIPSIDTLRLSPLLFPKEQYHKLLKAYYEESVNRNNPLKDCQATRTLFNSLLTAWNQLPKVKQEIYYLLLNQEDGFKGWFDYLNYYKTTPNVLSIVTKIQDYLKDKICLGQSLSIDVTDNPIALAYAIAVIDADPRETSFIPPWVLNKFSRTEGILKALRLSCKGKICHSSYCQQQEAVTGLQRFYGYPSFRTYEGEALQENAVNAALKNQSLLAIFPTGGGKSLTFQLPALMQWDAFKALTVVISPLQSLMKDQVDVLRNRHNIVQAATINGLLSPLERQEAFERVERGDIALLYISPESLRSNRILKLLSKRVIDRFVIDEAHCFSSWGQDFRVDYLYIADFIQKLQALKNVSIPVSCFTATAKPAVVTDILNYFESKLDQKLIEFKTEANRTNLKYHVISVQDEEEKKKHLLELLTAKSCPTIIYVSRTKQAEALVEMLQQQGFLAGAFHGKMNRSDKIDVMNSFMAKDSGIDIVVATSAFGMGVDKDNVEMVIHYTISDSLENYVQEAGRAGRNPELEADCYVFFNETDLDQHFQLLNNSRISQKEINQIWKGIKQFHRNQFIKSAKEIAKKAGWDIDMYELETRVKSAIAALEQSSYIKREENVPRIFADSLAVDDFEGAQKKISAHIFGYKERKIAVQIIKIIIARSKRIELDQVNIDDISDQVGISREETMLGIRKLKELGLLQDEKDLSAFFNTSRGKKGSLQIFEKKSNLEIALAKTLFEDKETDVLAKGFICHLRSLNETLHSEHPDTHSSILKDILNYWQIISSIKKERVQNAIDSYLIQLKQSWPDFKQKVKDRKELSALILHHLSKKATVLPPYSSKKKHKKLVEFSIGEIKSNLDNIGYQHDTKTYEEALLYLQHLGAIELSEGFLVFYNPMKIEKIEKNSLKQYTQSDYEDLGGFYQHKTAQIHIVGEYAKRYIRQETEALEFVQDYFTLDYDDFIKKYFDRKTKAKLARPITDQKFEQIIGNLSLEQMEVFKSKDNRILVAAGPGSGKTKLLVHKVASLLLIEEVKPEQFLMLTFSRPAALEFKYRLVNLVGPSAYGVDIHTFHGFAFQMLGRLGDLERSQTVLEDAVKAIRNEEIPLDRILSKTIVVVDEYQDVSGNEYELIMAILEKIGDPRIIAVGDDDQNIYEFRGASIEYMQQFQAHPDAKLYFLTKNFRSAPNIVHFNNLFLNQLMQRGERIKGKLVLEAHKKNNGQLKLYAYQKASSLIIPLVEDLREKLNQNEAKDSYAVLVYTNEEAELIHALLQKLEIPSRLIATKEEFKLKQLIEIQIFQYFISQNISKENSLIADELWNTAKSQLVDNQKGSSNLSIAMRIITNFERAYPKKYVVDWQSYLSELRIQDFFSAEKQKVIVSTMHKAKGKEFDQVWLLVNHRYPLHSSEKKRVLYVALSRAMQGLHIHTNLEALEKIAKQAEDIDFTKASTIHPAPTKKIKQCSLSDIWLDYSKKDSIQKKIKKLKSGELLTIRDSQYIESNGYRIGCLSTKFKSDLKETLKKGYEFSEIKIGYIVLWKDQNSGESYRMVLPKIEFTTIVE